MQNPSDLIALSRCLYVRIQSSRANDPFQNGSRFQEEGKVFFFYEFSYRYIYLQSRSKESWIEDPFQSIITLIVIKFRNVIKKRIYIYILLRFSCNGERIIPNYPPPSLQWVSFQSWKCSNVSLSTDRESTDDRLHPSDLKLSTPRDIRLGEGGNSKLVRLASYFSSERFEFRREN